MKCLSVTKLILPVQCLGVDEDLSYEELHIGILDRQIKWVRNKEIDKVKVLLRNNLVEGAIWEVEANMRSRNPHLLCSRGKTFYSSA